jgi:carbon monoxide dehydrogenase subunit G
LEQSGEYHIAADLQDVWRGLNDPEILASCIEGCQSMEKLAEDRFAALVKAKVGPVSATFQVSFELADVVPPHSYTIRGNVKGGAAGFAKGTAEVSLQEEDDATLLQFKVQANVGGKLAQVGSRLIDGIAHKMADDFFASFARQLSRNEPVAMMDDAPDQKNASSGQWKIWVVVFAVLILAMVLAF